MDGKRRGMGRVSLGFLFIASILYKKGTLYYNNIIKKNYKQSWRDRCQFASVAYNHQCNFDQFFEIGKPRTTVLK
jgi:hypothetical protein